ncbi:MAG: phosphoribosylformylglycinamidine cyclo-ligase [Candidatus Omnitrophota bacterium]
MTYKKSGVDIKKADDFVKGIKSFLYTDALSKIAAFGCPFDLGPFLKDYKNPVLVSSTDGVGTKLKIAQEVGIHNTVGIDLVAMNVNDVICLGARPLFFLDYIACGKVKPDILKLVVSGIHRGLVESNCSLIGGETAEMPGMYKEDEYDLAGFCVGIADKDKMINGACIKRGDAVIGLESNGLHSNGFSLARKVLGEKGIVTYAKELLKPTRIYVKPILSLLHSLSSKPTAIKAMAHITGGAFYKKATKILPQGLAMAIDRNSWEVPRIFKIIQENGSIEEKELYTVFNMGIGMVLVVNPAIAKKIVLQLSHLGLKSWLIGEIIKSDKQILLG